MCNFILQKRKFAAGTFDSDTSVDQIQGQSNREMEPDSPVKMPGGKRDLCEVRLASH